MKICRAVVLLLLLSAGAALAQEAAPQFDVATIRPNTSGSGSSSIHTRDQTLVATNVDIYPLLEMAFGIKRDLVSGMPSWAREARYDIDAKSLEMTPEQARGLTREQRRAMLQKLLEERFALRAHIEVKTLPVYDLTIAKSGVKFKEYVQEPGGKDKSGSMNTHNADMTATGVPMQNLASFLADQIQRTVIDKTGLTGIYDLHLKWTPDDYRVNGASATNDDAPPLFTALEEQLGLKLVASKGPVDTLVIDHIDPPTEN